MKPTAESVTEGIDLSGRTAIVTGSTSGLGREAARVLALRGAHVVFACRNEEKGHAVIAELAASLPAEAVRRCDVRRCDLASMSTVRSLAASLARERRTVDIVLLNAGVFNMPYRLTEDGLERTVASNFAGHFLLVHDLLTLGVLSPRARIVATLSEAVRLNPFLRADLAMLTDPADGERRFSRRTASPNSKVLTTLAMQRFTRAAATTPFAAASFDGCDPGPTLTDNVNQAGPVLGVLARAASSLLFKPVERGASVLVWAATEPTLAGRSGRIFTGALAEVPVPKRWTDPDLAERVWRAAEQTLGVAAWP